MNLKKEKALFEIFILICAIFTISLLNVNEVSAANVCCEKTTSGDSCAYVDESECASDSLKTFTSCEQTSFCKTGCCFSTKDGNCYVNTPKATCIEKEGTFDEDAACNIPQCSRGCCQLAGQCAFVTETRCKKEAAPYEDLALDFKESITSEFECISTCLSAEKGCCVTDSGETCKYTTRSDCISLSSVERTNATTEGFFKDTYCSDDKLSCECISKSKKGCLPDEDDVYWFDSCGNPESIAEDCDYSSGTLCGQDEDENYICKNLNCKQVYSNDASPDSGSSKLNGESWCIYDAGVGFGSDVVGSRHFKHVCINGEEIEEECEDFRREICISQDIEGYTESQCRDNRWEDCSSCDPQSEDPTEEELKSAANCCLKNSARDCTWFTDQKLLSTVGKLEKPVKENPSTFGRCIPHFPPGFKFWEGEGADQCGKANQECVIKWKIHKLSGKEEIIQNEHCLEHEWVVAANNYCKTLGDCGAYFNIIGDVSMDGFSSSHDPLKKGDVGDWGSIQKPVETELPEEPGTLQKFWDAAKAGLIVFGLTGIWSMIGAPDGISKWQAFTKGAFSGVAGLGNMIKGASNVVKGKNFIEPFKATSAEMFGTASPVSSSEIWTGGIKDIGKVSNILGEETVSNIKTLGPLDSTKVFSTESGGLQLIGEGGKSVTLESAQVSALKDAGLIDPSKAPLQGPAHAGLGSALQILNTIILLYTIYKLIDTYWVEEKEETRTVTCSPWQALEINKCEECNKLADGEFRKCSEYRCKSLGASCTLLNQGTGNETCINQNPNDVSSPVITAGEHDYEISEQKNIGFEIIPKIPPFTNVDLHIETNEPAQCKLSPKTGDKFEQMPQFFGSNLYAYKHDITFKLPGELATEQAIELTNGGRYNLYLKCQDGLGNTNAKDYFIKFQIDDGPDLQAPIIEATSVSSGAMFPANINETDLSIYLNEPSLCKWDTIDQEFKSMKNEFNCVKSGLTNSPVFRNLYKCNTELKNLNKDKENIFFFRCKDLKENEMVESYLFELKGTDPLEIISVKPEGTVYKVNLEVKTAVGALKNGEATCGYGTTENKNEMVEFFETNSNIHKQELILNDGDYTYYVSCVDVAGNIAESSTKFTVFTDVEEPKIIKIFEDKSLVESFLHVSLNEPSTCEYSLENFFKFGSGIRMPDDKSTEHEATFTKGSYYIICNDLFNNSAEYIIYT